MVDKEKLTKKTKLIFLVEFLILAAVLYVIGFLRMCDVIPYSANRLLAYNIITLVGFAYIYFDFFFSLFKKSRRAKTCFLDKTLSMIVATYLVVFDILVLSKTYTDPSFIKYSTSAVMIYAASISLFMGIYHHFKPTQQVLDAIEEQYNALVEAENEEKANELAEEKVEEKTEETKEE